MSHSSRAEAVGEAIVQLLQEDTGKKYIDEGADLVETLKRRLVSHSLLTLLVRHGRFWGRSRNRVEEGIQGVTPTCPAHWLPVV